MHNWGFLSLCLELGGAACVFLHFCILAALTYKALMGWVFSVQHVHMNSLATNSTFLTVPSMYQLHSSQNAAMYFWWLKIGILLWRSIRVQTGISNRTGGSVAFFWVFWEWGKNLAKNMNYCFFPFFQGGFSGFLWRTISASLIEKQEN